MQYSATSDPIDAESRPLSHLTDAQVRAQLEAMKPPAGQSRAVRMNPLASAFADAGRSLPYAETQRGYDPNDVQRIAKPAATRVQINLAEFVSNGPQSDNIYAVSNTVDAGQSLTVDPRAVISSHSVAVQSGVRLVLAHPRNDAVLVNGEKTSGTLGLYRDTALVRRTLPAAFQDVADGAAAANQALPFKDAEYSWPDAPFAAFSTTVTRAMDKAVGGGETLWSELMNAILGGLGEYADRVFFAALAAATPTAFDFSKVATQYLQESDIRAVTNGVGAGYRGDGVFSVSGVPAMLSAQAGGAYVYAPATCVVALWPSIDVVVSRLNVVGDAKVSVFASAQAIVPDANVVWSVAA